MFHFLWDIHQQTQIGDAAARISRGESESKEMAATIRTLEARLDAMTLACTAMWSLLQTKFGLTDQEFAERLNEIDLRDGTLDGRIAPEIKACPKCGRTMSLRHARCLYCGDQHLQRKPFEGAR